MTPLFMGRFQAQPRRRTCPAASTRGGLIPCPRRNSSDLRFYSDSAGNIPEWAEDDPRGYWAAADAHERANGRLYRQAGFALPRELNAAEHVEWATRFSEHLPGAEWLPYTLAVHRGGQDGGNPHAHLMFSERTNDGIERSAAQWFKRYNAKEPEKGGARKTTATKPRDWLEQTREA